MFFFFFFLAFLPFLDYEIAISNVGDLNVYHKPMHIDQHLRFDSYYPLQHKLGVNTEQTLTPQT